MTVLEGIFAVALVGAGMPGIVVSVSMVASSRVDVDERLLISVVVVVLLPATSIVDVALSFANRAFELVAQGFLDLGGLILGASAGAAASVFGASAGVVKRRSWASVGRAAPPGAGWVVSRRSGRHTGKGSAGTRAGLGSSWLLPRSWFL
ncbi:MAG: hypothetical protein U0166_10130 [Acidobacteriota bacterium]